MSKRTNHIPPALKHGGYSGMTLLPGEDPAAFEKFHRDIVAEYNPVGRSEEDIVEDIARLMWRKQNLSTYRLAEYARTKRAAIYAHLSPPSGDWVLMKRLGEKEETRSPEELRALRKQADEKVQNELGPALELVEIGDVATVDYLLNELSIRERLDSLIDRKLKQLLFVRGLKSLSLPSSAVSPPARIGRAA